MQETQLPNEPHVRLPNAATLERLMAHRGEHSVSIYFPTVEAGPETRKNRIHFKNAIQEAEAKLRDAGADDAVIKKTLAPLDGWELDEDRWAHQGHGKAIFLCDGEKHAFRLPAGVEARTLIGDRFHVLPLLQLQSASADHYVLCLDPQGPELMHASTFAMEPVVMDFPTLQDVLGYDLTEARQQGHSTNSNGGRWILHGHGEGSSEERKKELRKYFSALDEDIRKYLPSERTPLVIVAVDYVGVIYEDASDHPTIVGRVEGSPSSFDRQELHRRAFEVAEDALKKPRTEDLERLEEARRGSKAATGLGDVLRAAADGRVDTLFVSDAQVFGTWDPEGRSLDSAPDEPRTENDLADLAAREVIAKGGRVRFVESGELPVDEPLAAVLRF